MRAPGTKARWRTAAVAVVLLLAPTGCADDAPPGENAPALGDGLDEVDAAIESGDRDEARQAVEDLIEDTAKARVEGDITDDQADRIFDAAQALLDRLRQSDDD